MLGKQSERMRGSEAIRSSGHTIEEHGIRRGRVMSAARELQQLQARPPSQPPRRRPVTSWRVAKEAPGGFLGSEGPTDDNDEFSSDSGSDISELSGDCGDCCDLEDDLPPWSPCDRAPEVQSVLSNGILEILLVQEETKTQEDVALKELCGRIAGVFSAAADDPEEC